MSGHFARCDSQVRTRSETDAAPLATATYTSGYAPADLISAYKLPAAPVSGAPTVAIVDAYDAPNAEADLAQYRAQFSLPPCTTANGCFRKVNQRGVQNSPPAADSGWAQEISLDIDMVSAICPSCHILLVEADSNSYANLGAAVNQAASMGATQISNSYGGSEGSGVTTYDSQYYNHPGIDVTVSSGDNGYGVEFPASSPHVTAVGGTNLVRDTSTTRGWAETAWSGAGSGCSAYFAKPSWQTDTGCSRRTVADQSAVADPNTGVAVYDSYPSNGQAGWMVFGGTSVASPVIAAVDALAGGRAANYGAYPYSHHADFFDVSGGSNGVCLTTYLCNAVAGYDGPTGVGTPNGARNTPDGTGTTPPPTAAPDFTLTASPSSQLVHRSGTVTYTATIAGTGGWTGTASLSASGTPSGTTVSWPSGTSTSGGSLPMNVTVNSTAPGTYALTITATDGANSHTAQVTLQVKRK